MPVPVNGTRTLSAGGVVWHCHGVPEGSGPANGGAPPLVVLHGLFGSGDNWSSQARALTDHNGVTRPVLVPDLPDHGDSLHLDSFSYQRVAALLWDLIPRVLQELFSGSDGASGVAGASGPVELLGHSMGGKIAMAMALLKPGRVSRIVVVDIAPVRYAPRHQEILAGMRAVREAAPGSRGEAERILARFIPEKPVRLFLLKSLVPGQSGNHRSHQPYQWKINLEGIIRSYESISDWPFSVSPNRSREGSAAPAYSGPALFVRGERSPYVDHHGEEAIGAFFPRAVIRTVAGAGHWVHAEARETFLSVVRSGES